MRLVNWPYQEGYQPLDRGAAFVQFYENGDKVKWHHPMLFNLRYWQYFIQWADLEFGIRMPDNVLGEALMMGGEL